MTEAKEAKGRADPARSDAETHPNADSGASIAAPEAGIDGEIGATIGPVGSRQVESFGRLRTGFAWSTSKVPIALRLLQDVGGPTNLNPAQADEIRRALTLSDNEAAAALFSDLERRYGGVTGASAAVDEVLREAGDESTTSQRKDATAFPPTVRPNGALSIRSNS